MTNAAYLKCALWAIAALLAAGAAPVAGADESAAGAAPEFAELEDRADEVVKVSLWGRPLEQAKKLLGLRHNVTAPVRGFLNGLTAVYRRTYRFRGTRTSEDDVATVHQHLAENGWVPMIETEDREKPESLSVYSISEDERVAGVTMVSREASEVTVLKILGPVDFEALSAITSDMGLPVMRIATTDLQKLNAASGSK